MRLTRTFHDGELHVGGRLQLSEKATHHLVGVLRLDVGDTCVLFNGDGHDYEVRLLTLQKRGAEAEIVDARANASESPLRITLAQGIARGDKMDTVLQKATELGVACIVPLQTDRTEVKLDAERSDKKVAHWRGVLAAACEQCGRARLPELREPQALAKFAAADDNRVRLILDPGAAQSLSALELGGDDSVTVAIGPEGGFSERDLATLKAAGYRGVRLGPRILRTETAGPAVIAALNALYGDWR